VEGLPRARAAGLSGSSTRLDISKVLSPRLPVDCRATVTSATSGYPAPLDPGPTPPLPVAMEGGGRLPRSPRKADFPETVHLVSCTVQPPHDLPGPLQSVFMPKPALPRKRWDGGVRR
jgi:hypothetical protein